MIVNKIKEDKFKIQSTAFNTVGDWWIDQVEASINATIRKEENVLYITTTDIPEFLKFVTFTCEMEMFEDARCSARRSV